MEFGVFLERKLKCVLYQNVQVRGQSLRSLRIKKYNLLRFRIRKYFVQPKRVGVGAHTCTNATRTNKNL